MTRHLTSALLAYIMAMCLAASFHLDDNGHEMAESASLDDARKAQQAAERFARAKNEMCGSENATAVDLADGSIQCLTKRGHKTKRVAL